MSHHTLISIGSNADAERRIGEAERRLRALLLDSVASPKLWTEAIGKPQEADSWPSNRFLNMLIEGRTPLGLDELQPLLKDMERSLGRNEADKRRGVVAIDIDILSFDGKPMHKDDWERGYVKQLLERRGN